MGWEQVALPHVCPDSSLKVLWHLGGKAPHYCWVGVGIQTSTDTIFSRRGRSTSLLLLIHWQCGEAGLAAPGSYGCPGPHLAFSDTSPTEASGHLISAIWGWKSRLSTQPLLVVEGVRPQFFSAVCSWSSVVIVWRFSILGGCPFPVPLPKQRKFTGGLFVYTHWHFLLPAFLVLSNLVFMRHKENPGKWPFCWSLVLRSMWNLPSSLDHSESPCVCYICNVHAI